MCRYPLQTGLEDEVPPQTSETGLSLGVSREEVVATPSSGASGSPDPHLDVTVDATVGEALSASRGLLAPLFNAVPELIVVLEAERDASGETIFRYVTANSAYLAITQLESDEIHGKRLDLLPTSLAPVAPERCIEAIAQGGPLRYEQVLHRSGKRLVFDASATPMFDGQGSCTHILWVARDITEMTDAAEALRKKSATLHLLQRASAAANKASSLEEAARIVLRQVCRHTGWLTGHLYTVDESGGLFPTPVWHLQDPKALAHFRKVTETSEFGVGRGAAGWAHLSGRAQCIKDASVNEHFERAALARVAGLKGVYAFPISVGRKVVAVLEFFSRTPAELDEGLREVMDMIGSQLSRVVERDMARAALEQNAKKMLTLSQRDDLTGLNNRRGFIKMSQFQLKLAKRTDRRPALLFVDLDNMKEINDQLGHSHGDLALTDLSEILCATFRESDILARVGGDEFCVLLTEGAAGCAERALIRLDDAVGKYNETKGRPFELSLSVGVCVYDPQDPITVEELIDRADSEMYRVKVEKRELAQAN